MYFKHEESEVSFHALIGLHVMLHVTHLHHVDIGMWIRHGSGVSCIELLGMLCLLSVSRCIELKQFYVKFVNDNEEGRMIIYLFFFLVYLGALAIRIYNPMS
jgi:hypothetical protein